MPDATTKPPARDTGRGFVFWMLTIMGVAVLAPCVLLPEWRTYEQILETEAAYQERTDALRADLEREQRLLEALRTDPGVVARLAQRDLGFRRTDERAVEVFALTDDGQPHTATTAAPDATPAWLDRLLAPLPDLDYDRVFCDDESRPALIAMSVMVLATAFTLFIRARSQGA